MNDEFVADRRAGLCREIAVPELAFELCAEPAHRHGATIGMRTLDALYVACAMELKSEHF